jgi:Uma2 family endonuclease
MAAADTLTRTRELVPESRISFHASWEVYETLLEAIGDRQRVRLAFDGERIELMSPSHDHDELRMRVAWIVPAIAGGLGVGIKGCGSTTRKQPPLRAVEPDDSYYVTLAKREAAAARRRGRKPDPSAPPGPVPDLAIEIDLSPSALDRPSIYAALGVPEVWRFDGQRAVIERLSADGVYESVSESVWLEVRPDELVRLFGEDFIDINEFMDRVRAFAREVLLPRREARRT